MRLPNSPNVQLETAIVTPTEKSISINMETDGGSGGFTSSGMTSAISTAGPKEIDLKLTKDLEEALKPHAVFESVEEMTHRMEILSKLDFLVKNWVRDISVQKNIPPSVAEHVIKVKQLYKLLPMFYYDCFYLICISVLPAWRKNLYIWVLSLRRSQQSKYFNLFLI